MGYPITIYPPKKISWILVQWGFAVANKQTNNGKHGIWGEEKETMNSVTKALTMIFCTSTGNSQTSGYSNFIYCFGHLPSTYISQILYCLHWISSLCQMVTVAILESLGLISISALTAMTFFSPLNQY